MSGKITTHQHPQLRASSCPQANQNQHFNEDLPFKIQVVLLLFTNHILQLSTILMDLVGTNN